jgi:hypothetical protein
VQDRRAQHVVHEVVLAVGRRGQPLLVQVAAVQLAQHGLHALGAGVRDLVVDADQHVHHQRRRQHHQRERDRGLDVRQHHGQRLAR